MTSRSIGYNWRNTLSDFASIAGILAGFGVAFIGIVLGWSVANTPIFGAITWGNVAVVSVGISTALFITASQLFLRAKDSDMWDLPEKYERFLKKGFKSKGKNWRKIREENLGNCTKCEMYGRRFYNIAIFLMFVGLGFLIAPYNYVIAVIVAGLGILLESWQWKGRGLDNGDNYRDIKEMSSSKPNRKNRETKQFGVLESFVKEIREGSLSSMFRDIGAVLLTFGFALSGLSFTFVQISLQSPPTETQISLYNLFINTFWIGILVILAGFFLILQGLMPIKKPVLGWRQSILLLVKKFPFLMPVIVFFIFVIIIILRQFLTP